MKTKTKGIYDLNRNWITDPAKVAKIELGHSLKALIIENTQLFGGSLTVDLLDIEQAPEWNLWIRHASCDVSVSYLVNKATRAVTLSVEYPSFKDGHFVEYHCKTVLEAARVFQFAVELLQDIRGAIDTII